MAGPIAEAVGGSSTGSVVASDSHAEGGGAGRGSVRNQREPESSSREPRHGPPPVAEAIERLD